MDKVLDLLSHCHSEGMTKDDALKYTFNKMKNNIYEMMDNPLFELLPDEITSVMTENKEDIDNYDMFLKTVEPIYDKTKKAYRRTVAINLCNGYYSDDFNDITGFDYQKACIKFETSIVWVRAWITINGFYGLEIIPVHGSEVSKNTLNHYIHDKKEFEIHVLKVMNELINED